MARRETGPKEILTMNLYRVRTASRNHFQPDLFEWLRERELRVTNRAARKLAERYGISAHHAAVLLAAAGVGGPSR
jgi:hypothetical protein